MRGRRVGIALSAVLLLAQVFRISPLLDVISAGTPAGVRLTYPATHVVFAPFTLLADFLNGGSASELKALPLWALLAFVLYRLARRPAVRSPRSLVREASAFAFFLSAFSLFLWWGSRWSRPIPKLVAADSSDILFDIHTHTSASHDGRPGFGAAENARWHARAGFDAAFVTDHNVFAGAARRPPRLLDGEELSLWGLHIIVLGNTTRIDSKPWDQSFDSSLALLQALHRTPEPRPYLIASLPEYWRNHWGPDLGRIISAGAEGLEVWTTSPKAMDFPPRLRRETIARARALGLGLFGATDMHGLGYTASVWNVAPLPGWRALSDSALTWRLIDLARARPRDIRVIALRRPQSESRLGRALAVPIGVIGVLRAASLPHVIMMLVWIWGPILLLRQRRQG